MSGLVFYSLALCALLFLSAFFSGTEAALFSLSRAQIRSMRDGSPAGREIHRLLQQPRRLLVSILLGNLIINIFATSTATAVCLDLFGEKGVGYSFALMAVMIMAFGEIFPKTIALLWTGKFATVAIFPLRFFHTMVWPIRVPLSHFSDAVINAIRKHLGQPKRSFTWDELLTAIRISRREGGVGVFEYEVLTNVLEFRHKIVKEIMTPSIHVLSASVRTQRSELLERFASKGFSRMPIFDESTDDIVGVLHIKDLIDPTSAADEADLRARVREPFFVQENTPINDLYSDLQKGKQHIAIVLDEYTSWAGIVTIEDILEELVGDIRDARDPKTQLYMRIDNDRIVVSGAMEIDDFNDLFQTGLHDDEHDTIAGFVIGATGRIPTEGETVVAEGLRFHIVSAEPNRIRKMRVERE